ncbi:MAG TPA: GAF domain-containing protein, partial [Planctomycetaceae bacterium]|nr:GAF domain-containing protein [Planctomycetaceae bacterium]
MMTATASESGERARLRALQDASILDTPAERSFDDIVRIAASLCDTPIALVSFVDEKRQWFKARLGLEVQQTPREYSFCAHAIKGEKTMVVEDASRDERFRENPLVTGEPRILFYAGAPIVDNEGYKLGTLCVIDRQKRSITGKQIEALEALARCVTAELTLRRVGVIFRERQKQLEQLLEEIAEGTILIDPEGTVVFLDQTARNLLGVDAAEIREVRWQQLLNLDRDGNQAITNLLKSSTLGLVTMSVHRTGKLLEV